MDIPAAQFKAECLKLMDQVAKTRKTITITKHGRPVAQLAPVSMEARSREIGMHHSKGRAQLSAPLRDWMNRALGETGINLLPLDADIAAESEPHGDPADRFLIAAAHTKNLILATRDRGILDYGKAGYVRVAEL